MNNLIKKLENEESKILCCNCNRVTDFTDNNEYECKYGLTSIYSENPKCKYFKRNSKYITCNGTGKIRTTYSKGNKVDIRYKKGKFSYKSVDKI